MWAAARARMGTASFHLGLSKKSTRDGREFHFLLKTHEEMGVVYRTQLRLTRKEDEF